MTRSTIGSPHPRRWRMRVIGAASVFVVAGSVSATPVLADGSMAGLSAPSASAAVGTLTFLTPSRLPDAQLAQPYLAYIVVDDPPGPSTFTFKVVAGRVPPGTKFVKNNLPARPESRVIGTPTSPGTYSFTVEASDNTGAKARRTFTATVLAAAPITIDSASTLLNQGTVGQPYGAVLSASGGLMPYTWAITAGTLPPGLSLIGDAFGTPSAAGTYPFTARVTDSRGATTSAQFTIPVVR